jgi:hypothetical protein
MKLEYIATILKFKEDAYIKRDTKDFFRISNLDSSNSLAFFFKRLFLVGPIFIYELSSSR